jgi:type I restriction enzyme S subunit
MALCDDLEARQAKKRETAVRLNRAALDALTTAEGPEEIAASFLRIAENFETLIDRAEKVDELREMIRQLAITGRLVRQDPGEEPVGKLLAAINVARGGYQPRQESIVDGEAVRLPDLPAGWSWALASDAATEGTVITYGIIKPVWVTAGVPTVRVKDIQDGKLVLGDIAHCTEERASRFSKTRLSPEDLVVAKDGATLGKTAVVPASLSGGNVTQHVLRFSIDSRLSREYVRLVVDAPHGQRWMKGETRGVALPGVNVEDFRRMPLPIPPVSEQKRIVAKVDQLMALCDSLEAALRRAEGTAQKLAEAVVAEIVA